ncbi:integrase [Bradyrhizobium sp. RT9b]|uniref:hypothetical protein n=1 Tax=Bradyrhizobium sp. RT9b TaxID=3156385 RepID=UPI0033978112
MIKLIRDRDGIYRYRRRIPEDVRWALRQLDALAAPGSPRQDKREEKKSLGKDRIRAQVAWEEHHKVVEARWAQLRQAGNLRMTLVQREAFAGDVYRIWRDGYPPGGFHSGVSAAWMLQMMQEIDGDVPRSFPTKPEDDIDTLESLHGRHVDAVLAKRGLIVSPYTRGQLIYVAQRAAKHGCQTAIKRHDGDPRPDPEADRYPAWPDPLTDTLAGLYASWSKEKPDVKAETKADFKRSIDMLVAYVGNDDVSNLTVKQIAGWLGHLKSLGLSEVRIRDGYFAAVNTVLNSARNRGIVKANPCDGIKPEGGPRPRTREKDLRDGEIYKVLRASLEIHPYVGNDVANVRRWVPWILAYTGARVSEITRLEERHIIQESGVWGFDIQQSKTGCPRIVPIHRHLVEQGFLEFVAKRKGMPLFFSPDKLEDAKLVIHKTRAEGLAEWVGALIHPRPVIGNETLVAPNHGWRHRFKTECRRIAMDREVRLYIQGHAFKLEGEKYGFFPLDVTGPWLDLFPTYDVRGASLKVDRSLGGDILNRAMALLFQHRTASSSPKAA